METVCLTCGDRGFPETLVFCNECQAYALHRYCLDGPVNFYDDISWSCEDCEAKLLVPYSHDQSTPLSYETSNFVNLANDASQASGELKRCSNRVKVSNQQRQKKIEEKRKKTVKKKANVPLSDSRSSPELEIPHCSISSEEESEFKNKSGPVPRDASNSNEEAKPVQVSQVTTDDDSDCAESDFHGDALPIAETSWRGSLCFCNKTIGTASGLVAHLSNLACSKVMKQTLLFPEELRADFLPRSMVWPKRFKNEGPTDQNIALYFFPENERAEKVFDMLVDDIIHMELAIRVVAGNAELLIFPSTVLPLQHRRFQAKYYLWGVFRGKKASRGTNDAECTENADFHKRLTWNKHSQSNTLSNSGGYGSNE